jgi:predicted SnoaL-like aldol condensation-catalyzing enzyme
MSGSIEALTEAMIAASKNLSAQSSEMEFKVRQLLADGDFVAAYINVLNNKSKPAEGGLRQIHLFRFEDDKIVEYWDITQQIMPNMPNAIGAF